MKPLKGSKTEANLAAAFAGESQARNKYTYYASKAKKKDKTKKRLQTVPRKQESAKS